MIGHFRATCDWALHGYLAVGRCRDPLRLGTAGILGGRALQGYLVAGHCRDIWWLGTGILGGQALQKTERILGDGTLQGFFAVGHCRDTGGWALQGYSALGHCRDTWWLGAGGILCGWALQGTWSSLSSDCHLTLGDASDSYLIHASALQIGFTQIVCAARRHREGIRSTLLSIQKCRLLITLI